MPIRRWNNNVAAFIYKAASLVSSEDGDSSLHILLRTLDSEEIEELVEVLLEGNAAQKKEETNAQDRLNFGKKDMWIKFRLQMKTLNKSLNRWLYRLYFTLFNTNT